MISLDELAELLADPEALERPVTDGASPLTVVDLTAAAQAPAAKLPAGSPPTWRVLIGWSAVGFDFPALSQFDVLLTSDDDRSPGWVHADDPTESVGRIASTCRAAPQAAVALAQLLRLRVHLPLGDALVAESVTYSMLLAGSEFADWRRRQNLPPSRPSAEPVVVADDGTTVSIALNRPEVRNAYSAAMRDGLVDILRGLLAGPTHPPIVLLGNGPVFSSGGDLSEFGTAADPVTAHAIRISRSPGLLLDALGDVTALVHGPCVGAGVELPAFCHRVAARPSTTFRLPEVTMGLLPGAGGTASLPRRIGRWRTAYLALSGEALSVEAARRWGLVDEIVDEL